MHANASASYGTYATAAAGAGIGGGNDSVRGSLQIAGGRSDGFNAIVNPPQAAILAGKHANGRGYAGNLFRQGFNGALLRGSGSRRGQ